MRVYRLNEHNFAPCDDGELQTLLAENTPVWVDMIGPTAEDLKTMKEVFHFHPLAIEDTTNQRQRPRVDEYGDYIFTILNPIEIKGEEVSFRELDVFIGHNYLVTVHDAPEPLIESIMNRCMIRLGQKQTLTIGYILYVLSDVVVDDYLPVLDAIEDEIDDMSEVVLTAPKPAHLERTFQIRRSLVEFNRVASQQRDMFAYLMREESEYITQPQLKFYMRDVYDHLLRADAEVISLRDTLDGLVNLYLSSSSNRLNNNIGRLTVLTIVFGAFAVITGFYGMNFEQTWPPFQAPWGVPFVLLVMGITLVVVYLYTRHRLR